MWKIEGRTPAMEFMIISKEEIKHFSKMEAMLWVFQRRKDPFCVIDLL